MDSNRRNNGNNRTRKRNRNKPPVRIPPFHYTKSEERREWTCTIYPHAELFLRAVGSIDWSKFAYEAHGVKAKFNKDPYYALGGAVEEIYNILYKKDILPGEELHNRVDPTADLDVRVCPIAVTPIHIRSYFRKDFYEKKDDDVLVHLYAEAAANFIVDELVAYFRPLEAKLNEIFPTALPFIRNEDSQSRGARRIERVGPLTVIYTVFLQNAGENLFTPLIKVQVKLTLPQHNLRYEATSFQDHMIELGFWEDPNAICEHNSFLYRPYNLRVRDLKGEVYGCFSGLQQRLEFIYEPEAIHKCLNYVYRLRFLMKLATSISAKVRKARPNKFGIEHRDLVQIGRILDALLDFVYNQTRDEKRLSIWFVYLEILRNIGEPIGNYVNIDLAMSRAYWFFDRIYADHTAEQVREIERRIGSTDINKVKMEMYAVTMEAMRERYLLNPPISCEQYGPPLRGPSLAALAALPKPVRNALKEEHRRRPPLYPLPEPK